MTDTERMNGGELRTTREFLGLTLDALAGMLNVRLDTVRRWEAGRDDIPYRVREEVAVIERYTSAAVDELVAALRAADDPVVVVYRSDDDLHAARSDMSHLPARWWRHVVARAAHEVHGVEIVTDSPEDRDAR